MTIDRSWIVCWKETYPEAFQSKVNFVTHSVFIDGQIKLMKSCYTRSWRDYVFYQFLKPIQGYFDQGVKRVVLAFDNYSEGPLAKQMTQKKRSSKVERVEFNEHEQLPPEIPYNWDQVIMNRTFKTKVISLVCVSVPERLRLKEGQELVIDYMEKPTVFNSQGEKREVEDLNPRGESDVKFTRYIQDDMIVESIDGDYIPIALLWVEKQRELGGIVPRVFIKRWEINLKRKLDAGVKTAKKFEYVDIGMLYQNLSVTMSRYEDSSLRALMRPGPGAPTESFAVHRIRALCGLIALTGCDFTTGIPQVGPKTLWRLLPELWTEVVKSFDKENCRLDPDLAADRIVCCIYHHVYRKHLERLTRRNNIHTIMDHLKNHSNLSEKIRKSLPSGDAVLCCIRNCNWVIMYWHCEDKFPNAICPEFGYRLNKKGLVEFDTE